MVHFLLSALNFCTAQILGDTERPREIKGSTTRRFCRFIVTVATILGFAAVITVFGLNQPPKRHQRIWLRKQDLHNVSDFLDRMVPNLNFVEWRCPCKAMDVISPSKTAAHLVDFFLIESHRPERIVHVHSIDHFCQNLSNKSGYFHGFYNTCSAILWESFTSSGWDFNMRHSNLHMNSLRTGSLNPVAFMSGVCMSWAGGLSQASSSFLIANFGMKKEEAHRLNTFLKAIRAPLVTCAKHTTWPPPNNTLYLAEARAAGLDSAKFGYVIAIAFNWSQYFSICDPSYCEHLKLNSPTWNLFTALAQVGGFVSLAIFALRSLLWPLLCLLAGWPNSCEPGEEADVSTCSKLGNCEV